MKRFVRRVTHFAFLGLILPGLLFILNREWPDRSTETYIYDSIIHGRKFDFIGWELEALGGKALYSLAPPHTWLSKAEQKTLVLEYFDQLRLVQRLESEIGAVYADPAVSDPDTATVDLQKERIDARARLAQLQPLAEGIIEEQIAAVLADEGLTAAGRTFPPVKLRFTPLPAMLVISPRERIEAIRFYALEHGLDTPERVDLETQVDAKLEVSSLVANIGGLAAYPSMMLESSSFNWVISTGAHEWTHHYLTLRPLGMRYDTDPQLRTMNETVASIVGNEIGAEVVRRYYPELVPPPPSPPAKESETETKPPTYDFRAEMHETRLQVDELLAQGQIEAAEAYMETRRQPLWDHGYRIRKLNQAYFAFHGAYADEPGEQGKDPVGPAVVALREQSGSVKEFLETAAPLGSFEQLEALIGGED